MASSFSAGWLGRTEWVVERALDGLSLRSRVRANNIAHADTPHFKRSDVPFEAALRQALDGSSSRLPLMRTHPDHLPKSTPPPGSFAPVVDHTTRMRNDGNNVDIEAEMANLARDQLWYEALTTGLSNRFARLRQAIEEGRR
ncbi:MAG TPA: flagellar basal body rod protein FlgB [Limnochordia bacterium]